MSATPIPRSLALILYGDLDLSIVDELPPGRTPVRTRIVPEAKRDGLYRFIIEQAAQGHQCYIVCPLVEENEDLPARSAQDTYAELCNGALSCLRLGLTYGAQDAAEKERTLAAFSAGEIDVLIATTVIEVGVNVPSATVMVIENADRFGLCPAASAARTCGPRRAGKLVLSDGRAERAPDHPVQHKRRL